MLVKQAPHGGSCLTTANRDLFLGGTRRDSSDRPVASLTYIWARGLAETEKSKGNERLNDYKKSLDHPPSQPLPNQSSIPGVYQSLHDHLQPGAHLRIAFFVFDYVLISRLEIGR